LIAQQLAAYQSSLEILSWSPRTTGTGWSTGLMDNGHQLHLANTAAIQQDVIEGEISSSSAAFLDIALLCSYGVDFAAAESVSMLAESR
jgi:hypothetical protein